MKLYLLVTATIRGFSRELKQNLDKTYEIVGFVKPNANLSALVDTAKEKVNKLTKEDTVVFWGGVNDVSKNNSVQGLTQMVDFMSRNE